MFIPVTNSSYYNKTPYEIPFVKKRQTRVRVPVRHGRYCHSIYLINGKDNIQHRFKFEQSIGYVVK